uniref:CULT domain-containing protein n=1 Tax=Anopheles epiroticus TaxID=199890 RepID=A0A182PS72_9DIPT
MKCNRKPKLMRISFIFLIVWLFVRGFRAEETNEEETVIEGKRDNRRLPIVLLLGAMVRPIPANTPFTIENTGLPASPNHLNFVLRSIITDFFICRTCGHDVSVANLAFDKYSPFALSATNHSFTETRSVLIQEVQNPLGIRFHIFLVKQASCAKVHPVMNVYCCARRRRAPLTTNYCPNIRIQLSICVLILLPLQWTLKSTWFPGYAWKVCVCPKCHTLLGWMFEPVESATAEQSFPSEAGFYAIIYQNIITEGFVNSLLMKEKALRDN